MKAARCFLMCLLTSVWWLERYILSRDKTCLLSTLPGGRFLFLPLAGSALRSIVLRANQRVLCTYIIKPCELKIDLWTLTTAVIHPVAFRMPGIGTRRTLMVSLLT